MTQTQQTSAERPEMSDTPININELLPKSICRKVAEVWYSPGANRRYFTKQAAINAEAEAIIRRKYPTEHAEHDEGRIISPGWWWRDLENSDKLFRRVRRLVKAEAKKSPRGGGS